MKFKVWYSKSETTFPREETVVDAENFGKAYYKVQEKKQATVVKVIDLESGLELPQLTKYHEIQAKRYRARWYDNQNGREEALRESVHFEYYHMPNLEYSSKVREQLYIPPYRYELLPDHLKRVVDENKKITHRGNGESKKY